MFLRLCVLLMMVFLLAACGDSHERTLARLQADSERYETYQGELERSHRQRWPNPTPSNRDSLLQEDASIIARHNQLVAGYRQLRQQHEQGELSDEQAVQDADGFRSQHNQLRRQHEALVKLQR